MHYGLTCTATSSKTCKLYTRSLLSGARNIVTHSLAIEHVSNEHVAKAPVEIVSSYVCSEDDVDDAADGIEAQPGAMHSSTGLSTATKVGLFLGMVVLICGRLLAVFL